MTKECPKCETSDAVRIIQWGLPEFEPDPAKFVMGGCIAPPDKPDYVCLTCSTEFYKQKNEWRNRFIWDSLDGISIQCRDCEEWVPASAESGQHICTTFKNPPSPKQGR